MSTIPMFSNAALAILNRQVYDPTAKGDYEIMSGGLLWSDEFPQIGSPEWPVFAHNWVYRFLLAYRASITMGEENALFRPVWQQAIDHAPNWPGLREERRGKQVQHFLIMEKQRFYQELQDYQDIFTAAVNSQDSQTHFFPKYFQSS